MIESVYVIGSLRNERIPVVAAELRNHGYEVFDDWYSAGPEADDYWRDYERSKGRSYSEALAGYPAQHVFAFDKHHLDRCDAAVLVYPAGKSAHLELGYSKGRGKRVFVLMDQEPERMDVMLAFADRVVWSVAELAWALQPCKDHGDKGNSGGYASCKVAGRWLGKHVRALIDHTGEPPAGRQACHHCDNPRCIEPRHLFWGSQAENLLDARNKKRYRKLTLTDARAIKLRATEAASTVAADYDISPGMVRHIWTGRQWAE